MKDDRSEIVANQNDFPHALPLHILVGPDQGGLYARYGKRAFDLVFTTLALPVLSPVIALAWAAVALDGRHGFYGHRRVTQGGKQFYCWKLRTMVLNADALLTAHLHANPDAAVEWAVTQKLKNDPRITKIGRFLRKSRMDELPQLWNVLIGDMSLVGPRPFTPSQEQMYRAAGGRQYYALRPGVTGAWQVAGSGADGQTSFAARAGYDNDYAASLSLMSDLRIICKTVLTVLRMNGQ